MSQKGFINKAGICAMVAKNMTPTLIKLYQYVIHCQLKSSESHIGLNKKNRLIATHTHSICKVILDMKHMDGVKLTL